MSTIGSGEIVTNSPKPTLEEPSSAQCSTYTFPEGKAASSLVASAVARGHGRSASHGGGAGGPQAPRPSALKSASRGGHQRALSHGQISEAGSLRPGHSRVGSKTDFILPPGHKDTDSGSGGAGGSAGTRQSARGHSRQASRSESIYTLRRTAPPAMWRRLLCFVLRRTDNSEGDDRKRCVVPNHMVPPKTPRKEHPNGRRPNNRVRTTKYTLLSFLPRNLLEQFHRIANLYFIFIVLLNWFPAINAFGKEISMIPVVFVLGVTAVKDLFEDMRRHASDKRINNSTCRIYHSEADRYKRVLWKDVRVGDLIHLSNNELVPADILLLRSSDPNGLCYIDTSHLDGETNLKQRQVARGFVDKQDVFEPSKFKSIIEVDPPTTKIYKFHGTMIHPNGERIPVGTENLLLRECLLKNTDFVEGIVLYAGHETKAMLNNGGPRYKRSKLERQMNLDVIWCVFILIFLCVVGAIGCKLWLNEYENLPEPFIMEDMDSTQDAILTFWTFIIILQIMIPLSLYVTLEMCKLLQVYHIHNNVDLYDPTTDKRIECRALNITEELGQVQYIFSDKTGTLTENKMIFRRCTIAGVEYNHPHLESDNGNNKGGMTVLVNPQMHEDFMYEGREGESRQIHAARIQEFLVLLAICNTVVVSQHPHYDIMNASGVIVQTPSVFEPPKRPQKQNADPDLVATTSTRQNDRYSRLTESRSVTPSPPLHEHAVLSDISCNSHVPSLNIMNSTEPPSKLNNSHLTEIDDDIETKAMRPKLLNIPSLLFPGRKNMSSSNLTDEQKAKLKRTPTPSPCELEPIFEAESPDELALVGAANSYKCKLHRRMPNAVSVSLPMHGVLDYEILNVLPFDSYRKCMSVIVKHPRTKEIILYCKGADSAILQKLAPVEDDSEIKQIINTTQQQLNAYARQGLRVLVMAKKTIPLVEYTEWSRRHKECELSFENHDRKIRDSYASVEKNLYLLGATGIEDQLQDGVPETLLALIDAGIVVWVLTGDKPETAINIAYSAKLFSPDMELLKLMARSKEAAESTIKCYLDEIDRQCSESSTNSAEAVNSHTQASSTSSVSQVVPRIVKKTRKRALVVDGKTLTFILDKRSNLTKPFLRLTKFCSSVLCCRATPLQKAYIVRVVKEELKMRTLAIGDGANDVSMIQTADVGIGISGQEGMQAVMAADFALSKFKYLRRFLLVHGHWSYDRLSRMVLYFFYKNAAFVFLVFWYQLYCGFSGAVMIDQMYLMLYNLFFTSLPPLAIGVYDQDAPEELLLAKPGLYRQGRLGRVYRPYSFWLTMADALYQSIAIFFLVEGAFADSTIDFWAFGTTVTTACMFVMLCHVAMETRSWTILHVGAIAFSIGSFYVFSLIYNTFCVNCFGLQSTYGIIQQCLKNPVYWLVTILSCVVALLPRLVFKMVRNMLNPDDVTRARISQRRAACRGEGFLVSWSRSTSASSIYRYHVTRALVTSPH